MVGKGLSGFLGGFAATSLLVACGTDSSTTASDGGTRLPGTGGATAGSGGAVSGGASTSGGTSSAGTTVSGGATSGGASSNGGRDAGISTKDAGSTRDAGLARGSGGSPDARGIVDASTTREASTIDAATDGAGGCLGDHVPVVPNADAAVGPINPIPASLWRPPVTFDEPAGTYVYLNSDSGDFVGGGQSLTYTQANSILTLESGFPDEWTVHVRGDVEWWGEFETMRSVDRLAVGYYANLTELPINPSVNGAINWVGDGRGCNTFDGWFAVDSVSYTCGMLTDLVLRFEQHCEGKTPALHGKIRWSASDETMPPGPVEPPPASLWRPAPGSTPSSGSFVYLESAKDDPVGAGATVTYTPPTAAISLTTTRTTGPLAIVSVTTKNDDWSGHFLSMDVLSELEPGYYPSLEDWPVDNPARGGLDWSGDGRGCNPVTGWFVVDSITYAGATIQSIDLRFEQRCDGDSGALHGEVRMVAP